MVLGLVMLELISLAHMVTSMDCHQDLHTSNKSVIILFPSISSLLTVPVVPWLSSVCVLMREYKPSLEVVIL